MDEGARPNTHSEPAGAGAVGHALFRTWSRRPVHRRRRGALAAVGVIILLAILLLGENGSPRRDVGHVVASRALAGRGRALGPGPDSSAGVQVAALDAAIARTLAYTPFVRLAGNQHRELALTFDDGPGPYTPEILGILEREHVRATFFEVGVMERYFHASTTRIAADGDAIGDHTFAHAAMGRLSAREQRAQLLEGASALMHYGAPFPRLFRPPYGSWNGATLAVLCRYHMLMVLWTVDTRDYLRPGVRAIVSAAVDGARPGAIILLHDAGGDRSQTVAALPKIIAELRARGYRLVSVPQLLLDNPAPVHQPVPTLSGEGG